MQYNGSSTLYYLCGKVNSAFVLSLIYLCGRGSLLQRYTYTILSFLFLEEEHEISYRSYMCSIPLISHRLRNGNAIVCFGYCFVYCICYCFILRLYFNLPSSIFQDFRPLYILHSPDLITYAIRDRTYLIELRHLFDWLISHLFDRRSTCHSQWLPVTY